MAAYVSHFAYELGARRFTVEESSAAGLLMAQPQDFRTAGFAHHHMSADDQSAYDLARAAVQKISSDLDGIGAIVYATCLTPNGNIGSFERFRSTRDVKHLMDYPASHLQADFGLDAAAVIGLNQQACTSMLGSLRLAKSLLAGEPELERVLCVTADRFPAGAMYEQSYNLISDGAACCVVSRRPEGYRVVATHAITNGALARATDDETVGSYFTYTHRLLTEILQKAKLTFDDIRWVVPQNTNVNAWAIISRLLGLDAEKVHVGSIADVGHIISSDNVVNLLDLERRRTIESGDRLLLFMAGFGLNWQSVILEKI